MILYNFMKLNNLKNYGKFLKENLDPWKLKQDIKSFNRQKDELLTIYGDLKDLSNELSNEFKDITLPYKKLLQFGGIEIDLVIENGNYYSNINWAKFLKGDYELKVYVPDNYDNHYLISMVIHEIRHMIDFTDENLNNGLTSFDMELFLREFNIGYYSEFYTLIYLSLEHELVARNNQIYPYIKFKDLSKEDSLNILKNSFIWKALNKLKSFNVNNFINNFELNYLIKTTNDFIKKVLYDNINSVENLEDVKQFYTLFNEYFQEISNKWESILLKEVDYLYERKVYSYNDNIIDGYKNVLINMWLKIQKKHT